MQHVNVAEERAIKADKDATQKVQAKQSFQENKRRMEDRNHNQAIERQHRDHEAIMLHWDTKGKLVDSCLHVQVRQLDE